MKYFIAIVNLEHAKLHYRNLAKQLHPDKGGTAVEFQKMQSEYKDLLLSLQQNYNVANDPPQPEQSEALRRKTPSPENELFSELGKLAKVLIKKQVPQEYLRQKMQTTESTLKKDLFSDIVELLDSFK